MELTGKGRERKDKRRVQGLVRAKAGQVVWYEREREDMRDAGRGRNGNKRANREKKREKE